MRASGETVHFCVCCDSDALIIWKCMCDKWILLWKCSVPVFKSSVYMKREHESSVQVSEEQYTGVATGTPWSSWPGRYSGWTLQVWERRKGRPWKTGVIVIVLKRLFSVYFNSWKLQNSQWFFVIVGWGWGGGGGGVDITTSFSQFSEISDHLERQLENGLVCCCSCLAHFLSDMLPHCCDFAVTFIHTFGNVKNQWINSPTCTPGWWLLQKTKISTT